ncbi:AAA family ATPase [Natronoglycomyces albus]|uniref:Nuclease SbcCD subunit C n=1 Tax=Natronoglycomyces albus TaxID=2811108 RepID=A0A895XMT7_9ACTN|nr:AAA family ATPase [Natronoglycomyces albus]QSB06664.1 AAA family ATPase [Natronoglycomyces albus]
MIQVEEVSIREFRGIRDLELKLKSKSFVVWGPNGSGKSGIVDAIDFALTGEVSRLKGEGYGAINLKEYGPHVLHRNDPAAAQVRLKVLEPVSRKTATISRNLKTPSQFSLDPDIPEVRNAIASAQLNRQITLSRREIIKYIVARPTERADSIQDLLKLEKVRKVRSLLKATEGKLADAAKRAHQGVATAEQELKTRLGLSSVEPVEICAAVNVHRQTLALPKIDTLAAEIDISDGTDRGPTAPLFDKDAALREVSELQSYITDRSSRVECLSNLSEHLKLLSTDPSLSQLWKQRALVTSGLSMITDAFCPLCDSEWQDTETLLDHLNQKHARSEEAEKTRIKIEGLAQELSRHVRGLRDRLSRVMSHANSFGPDGFMDLLRSWNDELQELDTWLKLSIEHHMKLLDLPDDPVKPPDSLTEKVRQLVQKLQSLPNLDAPQKATRALAIAQERWSVLQDAKSNLEIATQAESIGALIYSNYCAVADQLLDELFESVSQDFGRYYSIVNQEDESGFQAKLVSDGGKLDLSVDFYSQGEYPPAAYHSEGHQDGMGVCLYLALMKKLYGSNFRMAVLDDVVMSVDAHHRKQFCHLLQKEFSDVQFVITTHDEVWARQIKGSGLVPPRNEARFYGWKVEDGPIYESGVDFWDKIDTDLSIDDVSAAAARLRRNLEAILSELTGLLGGSVKYRSDGRYELGDFKNSVLSQHKKLLKDANKIFTGRQDSVQLTLISRLESDRMTFAPKLEDENWPLNVAVHFNDWANFSKEDFQPVVNIWKEYLSLFRCENDDCGAWISLRRNGLQNESLRCACGLYNLDLV